MTIETKFNPGDHVYYLIGAPTYNPQFVRRQIRVVIHTSTLDDNQGHPQIRNHVKYLVEAEDFGGCFEANENCLFKTVDEGLESIKNETKRSMLVDEKELNHP